MQSRHLKTVMNVWEQLHTHTNLLKPPSIAIVFSELYRAMKRPSGNADVISILSQCLDSA